MIFKSLCATQKKEIISISLLLINILTISLSIPQHIHKLIAGMINLKGQCQKNEPGLYKVKIL